jgi:hypothetical protein
MRHALVTAQLLRQARAASVPTEARGRPARHAVAAGRVRLLLACSIATLLAVAVLAVVLAEVW